MKFLTWQNPEQLIVAQEFIKIFKILSCGIKVDVEVLTSREAIAFLFDFLISDCHREIIHGLLLAEGGDNLLYLLWQEAP